MYLVNILVSFSCYFFLLQIQTRVCSGGDGNSATGAVSGARMEYGIRLTRCS